MTRAYSIAGALIILQALALYLFGQPSICTCEYVKVWEGIVLGAGNSQHLTDWYTFSHIIHGFLFYVGLWYVFPRMPVAWRLAAAVGIEAAWEVIENTPMVIEHYRQQALAAGYIGDSILNSVSDTIAMAAGFVAAWRLPVWGSIMMGLGLEALPLWGIRDGLSLNILGFVHQFDFISRWQSGK